MSPQQTPLDPCACGCGAETIKTIHADAAPDASSRHVHIKCPDCGRRTDNIGYINGADGWLKKLAVAAARKAWNRGDTHYQKANP